MSVDFNMYVEVAFKGLKEKIGEANDVVRQIWKGDPCRAHTDARNRLEELLRDACLRIEILNSYDFDYDRIKRHCYGWHPARYQVQCKLCGVERLCFEKAEATAQMGRMPPEDPCPWTSGHAIFPPFREELDACSDPSVESDENCSDVSDN
jgi:hypothetical protein